MSSVASTDLAGKVQREQQEDARELFERLGSVQPADVTVNYTLEKSSATLPGTLIRFVVLAVLFRLNSPKKWRLAIEEGLLPEPLRAWLGITELNELAEKAMVDWMPPRVFLDMLTYSRYGRRPHHPLLMWKIWLAMHSAGPRHVRGPIGDPDFRPCRARRQAA